MGIIERSTRLPVMYGIVVCTVTIGTLFVSSSIDQNTRNSKQYESYNSAAQRAARKLMKKQYISDKAINVLEKFPLHKEYVYDDSYSSPQYDIDRIEHFVPFDFPSSESFYYSESISDSNKNKGNNPESLKPYEVIADTKVDNQHPQKQPTELQKEKPFEGDKPILRQGAQKPLQKDDLANKRPPENLEPLVKQQDQSNTKQNLPADEGITANQQQSALEQKETLKDTATQQKTPQNQPHLSNETPKEGQKTATNEQQPASYVNLEENQKQNRMPGSVQQSQVAKQPLAVPEKQQQTVAGDKQAPLSTLQVQQSNQRPPTKQQSPDPQGTSTNQQLSTMPHGQGDKQSQNLPLNPAISATNPQSVNQPPENKNLPSSSQKSDERQTSINKPILENEQILSNSNPVSNQKVVANRNLNQQLQTTNYKQSIDNSQQQPSTEIKQETSNQQPKAVANQEPPKLAVNQGPPKVAVNQLGPPKVAVNQGPPMVSVNQGPPKVTVNQGPPMVSVNQRPPEVALNQGPPNVAVNQGPPEVAVNQGPQKAAVNQGPAAVMQSNKEPSPNQPLQKVPSNPSPNVAPVAKEQIPLKQEQSPNKVMTDQKQSVERARLNQEPSTNQLSPAIQPQSPNQAPIAQQQPSAKQESFPNQTPASQQKRSLQQETSPKVLTDQNQPPAQQQQFLNKGTLHNRPPSAKQESPLNQAPGVLEQPSEMQKPSPSKIQAEQAQPSFGQGPLVNLQEHSNQQPTVYKKPSEPSVERRPSTNQKQQLPAIQTQLTGNQALTSKVFEKTLTANKQLKMAVSKNVSTAFSNTKANQNESCKSIKLMPKGTMASIALLSSPGSGNTWSRFLIEHATGIYTSSVYNDMVLYKGGFVGEIEDINSGTTVVTKTHFFPSSQESHYSRVILLVRNPYNSILSEFNRQNGQKGGQSHISYADPSLFKTSNWTQYAKGAAERWFSIMQTAIDAVKPSNVLLIFYESLLTDVAGPLEKMVRFLGLPVDKSRLECTKRMSDQSGFHRPHKSLGFDPYTEELTDRIQRNIERARQLIFQHYNTTFPNYEKENFK